MAINHFKDYPVFTGHVEVTGTGAAPFDKYLYIECGYGATREAYALSDDCPLDIEFLIRQAFNDHDVIVCPQYGGPNYAAIITDGHRGTVLSGNRAISISRINYEC